MAEQSTCKRVRVSNFPSEGETDTEAHFYSVSLDFETNQMDAGGGGNSSGMPVCAQGLLMSILDAAFAEGYRARFEVARSVPEDAGWPLPAADRKHAEDAYGRLLTQLASGVRLLPVSIWLIPGGPTDVEARILEFWANSFDDALFESLLNDSVVRISISEKFCDIMANLPLAPVVRAWVRYGIVAEQNVTATAL